MTAEIAILNKSAVALATDSAATISSGNSNSKVFDSVDKLFELSCDQPIGVMIYNGMQFAGIPLPDLIKEFRSKIGWVEKIEDAAKSLLLFLTELGTSAPAESRREIIYNVAHPVVAQMRERIDNTLRKRFESDGSFPDDLETFFKETIDRAIKLFENLAERLNPNDFYDDSPPSELLADELDWIRNLVNHVMGIADEAARERVVNTVVKFVLGGDLSSSRTGIVIAGFGASERFPTLISYELEGVISGKLKFRQTASCDIDRSGPRAFIMPFAQKEMVERFLYGFDQEIQREIIRCR